jgi:sugar (pentulose or hexulose) kinase
MAPLLGIDVGTSSLKAVLFDEGLRPLASARREYPTRYPGPACAEQDPEDWDRALCDATRELLERTGTRPARIAAVGIAGMSSLALPVDGAGTPLRPAMIWLDRRARAQAERGRAGFEARQVAVSGNRCDPSCFAPKVAWIREHEPAVYARAAAFLHCNAFLVQRLTGAFTMDVSEAGLSLVCDIRSGGYSDELVRAWGLDPRKLPGVAGCTAIAGRVTPAAAARTGLAAGTPVIAGAMDNVAATVGLGLRDDGDGYIAAGTVVNVGVMSDRPATGGVGLVYHAGVEDRWLLNGGADAAGAGMPWLRAVLDDTDVSALSALGAGVTDGDQPLVFLPYLGGQRAPLWNDAAAGVLLGITPATERRHLARAVMEGVALAARHVFEQLGARRPVRTALTGGITHSRAWTQLMADATGLRLAVCDQAEVSTVGAAALAGVGVGLHRTAQEAAARVPKGAAIEPDPGRAAHYDALYAVFLEAYAGVRGALAALDRLRRAPLEEAPLDRPGGSPAPATLQMDAAQLAGRGAP